MDIADCAGSRTKEEHVVVLRYPNLPRDDALSITASGLHGFGEPSGLSGADLGKRWGLTSSLARKHVQMFQLNLNSISINTISSQSRNTKPSSDTTSWLSQISFALFPVTSAGAGQTDVAQSEVSFRRCQDALLLFYHMYYVQRDTPRTTSTTPQRRHSTG